MYRYIYIRSLLSIFSHLFLTRTCVVIILWSSPKCRIITSLISAPLLQSRIPSNVTCPDLAIQPICKIFADVIILLQNCCSLTLWQYQDGWVGVVEKLFHTTLKNRWWHPDPQTILVWLLPYFYLLVSNACFYGLGYRSWKGRTRCRCITWPPCSGPPCCMQDRYSTNTVYPVSPYGVDRFTSSFKSYRLLICDVQRVKKVTKFWDAMFLNFWKLAPKNVCSYPIRFLYSIYSEFSSVKYIRTIFCSDLDSYLFGKKFWSTTLCSKKQSHYYDYF